MTEPNNALRDTLAHNMDKVEANARQEGGNHYKNNGRGEQHWDRVHRLGMNWFAANVTKYVERYPRKNGLEDLKKARHYLDKLIEVEEQKYQAKELDKAGYGAVMQEGNERPHLVDYRGRAQQLAESFIRERSGPRHPYDGREAEGSTLD